MAEHSSRRIESFRRRFRSSSSARLAIWQELALLLDTHDLLTSLLLIETGYSEGGMRPNNLVSVTAGIWARGVKAAQPFADVVKGWVTPRERLFVEVSYNKPDQGQIYARMYEAERLLFDVKSQWQSAFTDPLFLIVSSWGMMIYFAGMVVDQFESFPAPPRAWLMHLSYDISRWLLYWGSWLLPAIAAAIAGFIAWRLKAWLSHGRTKYEAIWPFSLYKALQATDFLLAITILQYCGDDLASSLRAMAKTASPYLKWQIAALEPRLRSGPIGKAVHLTKRNFPDALVNARLEVVGHDSPQRFPAHLDAITKAFYARLVQRMTKMAKHTNSAVLVFIAILQVVSALLMLALSLPS